MRGPDWLGEGRDLHGDGRGATTNRGEGTETDTRVHVVPCVCGLGLGLVAVVARDISPRWVPLDNVSVA